LILGSVRLNLPFHCLAALMTLIEEEACESLLMYSCILPPIGHNGLTENLLCLGLTMGFVTATVHFAIQKAHSTVLYNAVKDNLETKDGHVHIVEGRKT
jgi:hypothetical protein